MNPYAILGGLVLAVAIAAGGWHFGARNERVEWQKKEIATQVAHVNALNAAIKEVQDQQKLQEAKAREATAKHEQAINELKKKYSAAVADIKSHGGLRIPSTGCDKPASSNEGSSTSRPNGSSTRTIELPERTQEGLFSLAERADALAEQLRALQGWIKNNGFYGESQ